MQSFQAFLELISSYQIKIADLKSVKHAGVNQFHLAISRDVIWKYRAKAAEVPAKQNSKATLRSLAV